MKKNKVIASVLTASMIMSSVPVWAADNGEFPDMPQNWSAAALTKAVDNGLLSGIDGKICADDYLTRAQIAAIMVRAFGAEGKADLSGYADVKQGDWYYQALSSAVSMGVLSGYDDRLSPNANITRQEVCGVVARAFLLDIGNSDALHNFADADTVAGWAKDSMAAMVGAGYLHGDDGKLKPTAYITRAEFAAIMANLAGTYIDEAGTVTDIEKGNVIVNATGVTLSGVTIQGDLILADGIGLGEIKLDNVKVTGRVIVRGGGNVSLNGNTDVNVVKVANRNGKTEIFVAEGSKVVSILSSTALDVKGAGQVGTVTITAGTGNVSTPNTTVKNDGGAVTAAGKNVPSGAKGVINETATDAEIILGDTIQDETVPLGALPGSSSGGGSFSGGSSSGSGSSSGGSGSGSGNVSGGSGSDLEETEKKPEESVQLVESAKVVDIGWAQYLVVDLQEGNADGYRFAVDGQSVQVSPIDDAANLVKWELSALNQGQLTVTRKLDEKQQVITLSEASSAGELRQTATAGPDYFLAHGAVFVWDYALTNYDADGNVRVNPAKTTFDLAEKSSGTVAYYAPDAELKKTDNGDNVYGVSGEVEVLFNYTSAADQVWFDGITDVDLVDYNESLTTRNDNLQYSCSKTEHYGSTVGRLTVPLGQSNFYSNGRYYLRVTSGGAATLIPIHVVNEKVPSMTLSEPGKIMSGQNVHFTVSDMTYGVTMPVYRVDLKTPDGETKTLEKIRDWYLIGDTFVLYNDVEAADGRNNIPESGLYTITVYADGFKPMSKSFTVGNEALVSYVDAVSHATGTVSGGSESGADGGSTTMNGNLLFDADLLANALILQELEIENAYAAGIAERWLYDMSGWDAAFYRDGQTFYTYDGFRDAVEEAKAKGTYLTFQDYVASAAAETTQNRPYAVKAVLEDNLLGETQTNGDYLGNAAADFFLVDEDGNTLTAAKEKKDVILFCADVAYLTALENRGEIYFDGDWLHPLSKDAYRIEDGTLIISAGALPVGENNLVIKIAGYQTLRLTVTIEKELDTVALRVKDKEDGTFYQVEETVVLEGLTEDFLQHLQSVTVNGRNVLTQETGGSSANDWYSKTEDGLTLQGGLFREAGAYTITVTAMYYQPQEVTVNVEVAAIEPETPGDEFTAVPTVAGIEYEKDFFDSYYRVSFEDESVEAYLDAITGITLNGEECEKVGFFWQDTNSYKFANDAVYGGANQFIDFTADCFGAEATEVVITATGYEELSFFVNADGTLGSSEEMLQTPPTVAGTEYKEEVFSDSYYRVSFEDESVEAYLDAIRKITLNGTECEKVNSFWRDTNSYKFSKDPIYGGANQFIDFTEDCFGAEATEVVITAEGYEELRFTVNAESAMTKIAQEMAAGGEAVEEATAEEAIVEEVIVEEVTKEELAVEANPVEEVFTDVQQEELPTEELNEETSDAVTNEEISAVEETSSDDENAAEIL